MGQLLSPYCYLNFFQMEISISEPFVFFLDNKNSVGNVGHLVLLGIIRFFLKRSEEFFERKKKKPVAHFFTIASRSLKLFNPIVQVLSHVYILLLLKCLMRSRHFIMYASDYNNK